MSDAETFDATALTRLARVGEIAVSPDGTWLAVVVSHLDADEGAYVSDLWRVPVSGGPAIALTRGATKDSAPRFRRDGALAFLSSRAVTALDVAPRPQVWHFPPGGGEPAPLTDEPLGVTDFAFAAAGDRLVVLAEILDGVELGAMRGRATDLEKHGPSALRYTETPVRHWDAWLPATSLHAIAYDEHGGDRRDLTPTARHHLRNQPNDPAFAVSADGARVAVAWSQLGADRVPDTWLHVVEVASGAARDLGRAAGSWTDAPRFARDGRLAAVRTTRAPKVSDRCRLWLWDADLAGDGRAVAPGWDAVPQLHGWADDGSLLVTADVEGHVPAFRITLAGEVVRLTALAAGGSHEHLRALGGDRFAGVRHRLLHPPEPFACELAPAASPRLLAELSSFDEDRGGAIARWESRWSTGDGGTPVQWFLIQPTAATAPAPLLLWVHGGPVGQFADGWHWRWNPLVAAAAGYALALPNPRGSTGRNQAFIDGVFANTWGGACYRDLMAVVDDAVALPGIDGARTVAMGGSYGGYMANSIGTQTNRFRALVSHAGLFHLQAFHGTTDYPGYLAVEFGQHPFEGDLEAFRRYSPDAHVQGWKTPVLFLHGEKDYRVPISEALLAFEAVRLAGVDAELLVFPDENHSITRPRNVRAWYQAWLEFVARRLG